MRFDSQSLKIYFTDEDFFWKFLSFPQPPSFQNPVIIFHSQVKNFFSSSSSSLVVLNTHIASSSSSSYTHNLAHFSFTQFLLWMSDTNRCIIIIQHPYTLMHKSNSLHNFPSIRLPCYIYYYMRARKSAYSECEERRLRKYSMRNDSFLFQ